MAMSHIQPVLFFLASLFFLPALCSAIDFEYCTKNGHDYGSISQIWVSPSDGPQENPTITIHLFGSASKDISAGTLVYVTYRSGDFTGLLKTYDLCDVSACNPEYVIEAGTDFELTLSDVLYVGFDEEIKYSVSLREKTSEEKNPIIKMCVDFKVPHPAFPPPALVSM